MTDKVEVIGKAVEQREPTLLTVIERMAMNPNVDMDKLERMLDMQERVLNRNAEQAYAIAMSQAQGAMSPIAADATNPQTKSKYASYAALDRALRPIYTVNGFGLSFDTEESAIADHIRVICYVSHSAGHTTKRGVTMPADGKGAKGGDVMTKTHAAGAAMSYGMRYLLKLIFNVAVGEDDNDGNNIDLVQLTEAIETISIAPNMEVLQKYFGEKWKEFTSPQDRRRLTAAKDERKKELANG